MSLYFIPSTVDMTIATQFPATSSFPLNHSLSSQAVAHVHPGIHSGKNVSFQSCNHHFTLTVLQSRAAAIAQSSSTTIKARLSGWWPINMGHGLPPIVDVPFTRGDQVRLVYFYHYQKYHG
jgi:hypothetical protein